MRVYILKVLVEKSLGIASEVLYVKLKNNIEFKPNLVYFLEAAVECKEDGTLVAEAIKGNGSGDFANLVKTDGFLILPQNKSQFLRMRSILLYLTGKNGEKLLGKL